MPAVDVNRVVSAHDEAVEHAVVVGVTPAAGPLTGKGENAPPTGNRQHTEEKANATTTVMPSAEEPDRRPDRQHRYNDGSERPKIQR